MTDSAPEPACTVRRVREEEWELVREVRLSALRDSPLAFGSTLQREQSFPPEEWRARVQRGASAPDSATYLAVDPKGTCLGMAGIGQPPGDRRFQVWGMWVRPSARGRGVGRDLLLALLEWVSSHHGTVDVLLHVNPQQVAAVHLYRSLGFEFTGTEEPLGHDAPSTVKGMLRKARP